MIKYKNWLFICLIFLTGFLLTASLANYFFLIKPIFSVKNYKFKQDIDTIIIGASHAACAFDSKKIENSLIIAQSGEPIFFTYYKLKILLEQNNCIRNVILTLSENSISKYQDHRVIMNYDGSKDLFFNYFHLLNQSGKNYLNKFSGNYIQANLKYSFGLPLSYNRDLILFIKFYFGKLHFSDFEFSGGPEDSSDEVHLEESLISKKINLYFYDGNNGNYEVSPIAIKHIYEIAKLCKNKSKKLFVFKSPLHDKFNKLIPQFYKTEYKNIIQELISINPTIVYGDYSDLKLPDSFYLDGDHLNKYGKNEFTKIIVNNHLLKVTEKRTKLDE